MEKTETTADSAELVFFQDFYNRNKNMIYLIAKQHTSDENEIADVVQDTILRLMHYIPALQDAQMLKSRLTEQDWELLFGKYVLGQSDEELARQRGCGPNSIRMALSRARKRAQKLLKKRGIFVNDKTTPDRLAYAMQIYSETEGARLLRLLQDAPEMPLALDMKCRALIQQEWTKTLRRRSFGYAVRKLSATAAAFLIVFALCGVMAAAAELVHLPQITLHYKPSSNHSALHIVDGDKPFTLPTR